MSSEPFRADGVARPGRLTDFERKAIYRRDPNDLIAAMPGWMRGEARQRAGKLGRWLLHIRDGGDDGCVSLGKCVTAAAAQGYADGQPTNDGE